MTAEKILRDLIRLYAANDTEYGWWDFEYEGQKYRFPKRAMMWYVFGKMNHITDRLPAYEAFSPNHAKMYNDNPYHTDVMLGTFNTDIGEAYKHSSIESTVFYAAVMAFEKEMKDIASFDFTILANGLPEDFDNEYFRFTVYEHEILPKGSSSTANIFSQKKLKKRRLTRTAIVIPHAGVEYELAALEADVIITEQGGKLSHLATVSRESGKLLIRIDNATKKFSYFDSFKINLRDYTLKAISL